MRVCGCWKPGSIDCTRCPIGLPRGARCRCRSIWWRDSRRWFGARRSACPRNRPPLPSPPPDRCRPRCRSRSPPRICRPMTKLLASEPPRNRCASAPTCSTGWSTMPVRWRSTARDWSSSWAASGATSTNSSRPTSVCANSFANSTSRPKRRSWPVTSASRRASIRRSIRWRWTASRPCSSSVARSPNRLPTFPPCKPRWKT